MVLRQVYFTSQKILTLNWPGIFYNTHAAAYARHRRRGESNFRIEIFVNIRGSQKGESEEQLPELAFLAAPYIREYFYT